MALAGAAGTASARETGGRQVHTVYQGQRLGSIAKRYNVSIEAICEANGIRRRDPIRPGQRLEIPTRDEERKASGIAKDPAKDTVKAAVGSEGVAPKADASPHGDKQTTNADSRPKESASKPASADKPQSANPNVAPRTPSSGKVTAAQGKVADVQPPTLAKVMPTVPALDAVMLAPNPAQMTHRVRAGESLSAIAVHYETNVKTLLAVNNLRKDQVIRVGQVLAIPKAPAPATWWGRFARSPRSAGEIEVFAHTHRWKGKVVSNGKVQPAARAAISGLLGATGSAPPVPERLIQLLAHVSDTFGGRPVRLVSGYRTNSYVKDSRHRHSCAVDFSITGVPNSAVRDYLLQLGNVGVGYYPNSTFVHLDVRARSAYWVDYAGPGEAPRKKPRAERQFVEGKRKPGARPLMRRTRNTNTPSAGKVERVSTRSIDAQQDQAETPPSSAPTAVESTSATSPTPNTAATLVTL